MVAIGEIGLDYSWNNKCPRETQHRVFAEQLKLAADLDLPVIIHNFQSYADCLQLIAASPLACSDHVGVLHNFTIDYDTAQRAIDLGLYLSFAAPITYKNAKKLPALVEASFKSHSDRNRRAMHAAPPTSRHTWKVFS